MITIQDTKHLLELFAIPAIQATIQDLKSIVGSNVLVLDFIQDAGHGWIQIPKNLSFGLNFSNCSYQDEKNLYLEMDCDMEKYLDLLDQAKIEYNFNHIIFNDKCSIRNKKRLGS